MFGTDRWEYGAGLLRQLFLPGKDQGVPKCLVPKTRNHEVVGGFRNNFRICLCNMCAAVVSFKDLRSAECLTFFLIFTAFHRL